MRFLWAARIQTRRPAQTFDFLQCTADKSGTGVGTSAPELVTLKFVTDRFYCVRSATIKPLNKHFFFSSSVVLIFELLSPK